MRKITAGTRVAPAENRLPRLVQGVEVKALPIGPSDAFVLSRVDGSSTEAEIAAATGIDPNVVRDTISRLVSLGAVAIAVEQRPAEQRPYRAAMASSAGQIVPPRVSEVVVRREHPGASLYDPAELNEDVDIEPDRRRTILDTFYRLELLNHYELLNLPAQADRRAIRSRYHEIINVFHPDRYYGRRLGSYKAKLERVFQRLTEAHDVLARPETRAEYDAYLNVGQSTRSLEQQLNDEEAHALELDRVRAQIAAEAGPNDNAIAPPTSPNRAVSGRPPMASSPVILHSTPPRPPTSSIPVPPSSSDPPRSVPPMDAEARKRALARKLGFSSPPPAARPSPAPSVEPNVLHERAATDLKRRYEQRMSEAQRRQVHEYVTRADAALAERKLVDAVNALRIAASLAPGDVELRQRLDDLQTAASKELADRYLEQAQYEEREHHWTEAARSYARAVTGKPVAKLHERIAHCLLMAHGDLKQAVEQARKAVLMSPNEAKFHQTLARAYVAANMRESALGELERAAALAPSDDTIREQLRRARRGEF